MEAGAPTGGRPPSPHAAEQLVAEGVAWAVGIGTRGRVYEPVGPGARCALEEAVDTKACFSLHGSFCGLGTAQVPSPLCCWGIPAGENSQEPARVSGAPSVSARG